MTILLKYICGKRSEHQTTQEPNQGTNTLEATKQLSGLENLVGITGGEKTLMAPQDRDVIRAGSSLSQDSWIQGARCH